MDALQRFLDVVRQQQLAQGNLLGLLHLLIGRRLAEADGTVISSGLTWRSLASWLKKAHWDIETVRELGLDPDALSRDRQRLWYTVIHRADVGSDKAAQAGDKLAQILSQHGYVVGPAPKKE